MTIVVAGSGGDAGKTLVSLGATAAWRADGVDVRAFKKGPDYIDAAWLSRAAARPARNLDTWIQGEAAVRAAFARHASGGDAALVEGNRGFFDGLDGASTAALAKTLDADVLLVLDVTKTTKSAAVFVAGCRALDPSLRIAGVVLNRVGGARHEREARKAVEDWTGVAVVGAVPRLRGPELLPDRHLGLVPPTEHRRMDTVVDRLGRIVAEHVDLERLAGPARPPAFAALERPVHPAPRVRIGWFSDAAFTFYYPENLEALEDAGAELVPVSPLADASLPDVDLLYAGGGFPETHASDLAANRPLLEAVRDAIESGLPVYAECGGLIYLGRSVIWGGRRHELVGALDFDVEIRDRPQGHGYVEAVVDRPTSFFPKGAVLRGHEFHYGRAIGGDADLALSLRRGAGDGAGRDGWTRRGVFASWLHLHALGTPSWAPALVRVAETARSRRLTVG